MRKVHPHLFIIIPLRGNYFNQGDVYHFRSFAINVHYKCVYVYVHYIKMRLWYTYFTATSSCRNPRSHTKELYPCPSHLDFSHNQLVYHQILLILLSVYARNHPQAIAGCKPPLRLIWITAEVLQMLFSSLFDTLQSVLRIATGQML